MAGVDGLGGFARRGGVVVAFAAALFPPAGAGAQATIEGRVELPKAAVQPVAKPRYPIVATYEVGDPDSPRAIVYLEIPPAERTKGDGEKPFVAQSRYQFSPGLLALEVGTAATFPNLDDEYHSVFSYSKPKRFDLGRYQRGEEPPEVVFDQPGVVRLFCEIHDHMRGTILVLDTPYFTRTDASGRYRLENLPSGQFRLRAWVGEDDERSEPVDLRPGSRLRVDFPAGRTEAPR